MKKYIILIVTALCYSLGGYAQLNGYFSVSSSKQVRFSRGNLQYRASSGSWQFATNQYDIIGTDNSNISSTYSGYIDLFGFGTSGYNNCMPYETGLSVTYGGGLSSIAGTNYDWGVKNFSNYRTLTASEWSYLIGSRNNASSLRAPATVNGVTGWILLPDSWSSSLTFTSYADGARSFDANVITASSWSSYQNAGAVFLPACGWRYSSGSASMTSYVGSQGYYWSTDKANAACMGASYFYSGQDAAVYSGCAVRLVYDTSSGGGSTTTQYTLTVNASPAAYGTVTGGGTYNKDAYVTVKATANSGYEFVRWTNNTLGTTYGSESWTFRIDRDMTLTAEFSTPRYCVDGIASPMAKGTVTESSPRCGVTGTVVTLTATPYSDTKFTGWSDGVTTATRNVTIANSYVSLYAYFESTTQYTVTASPNNSAYGTVTGSGAYDARSSCTLRATPNDGYLFTGWSDGNTQNTRTFTVTGNLTLTALFEQENTPTYEISVQAFLEDYGTVTGGGTYEAGDYVTLTATPNECYDFDYWYDKISASTISKDHTHTFLASADMQIIAYFYRPVYSFDVAINNTNYGNVSEFPVSLYKCDDITITATPYAGYKFSAWIIHGTENTIAYENPLTVNMQQDTYIECYFVPGDLTYQVQVTAGLGGTVNNVSGQYNYGDEIELIAKPDEGYIFSQWSDGNSNNPRTLTVTNDITLEAQFTAQSTVTYNVSITAGEGGTVSEVSGVYPYGTVLNIEAIPNSTELTLIYYEHDYPPYGDYLFTQWSDGVTDKQRTITVTSDITLEAQFRRKEFYYFFIVFNRKSELDLINCSHDNEPYLSLNDGYIEKYKIYVAEDMNTCTFKAIDGAKTTLDYWEYQGQYYYDNPLSITITQDNTTLTANFREKIYYLFWSTNTDGGSCNYGYAGKLSIGEKEEIVLEATPDEGYRFHSWSDGSRDNPRSIIMTQDTIIYPIFYSTECEK